MSEKNELRVPATVTRALPNRRFQLDLGQGHKAEAYLSGPVMKELGRRNGVKNKQLVPGDKVTVEFSRHDITQGRIVAIGGKK